MNVMRFVDTNILLYAVSTIASDARKHAQAANLIESWLRYPVQAMTVICSR